MLRLQQVIIVLCCLALLHATPPVLTCGQAQSNETGTTGTPVPVNPLADKPEKKRVTIAMLVYPGFTALDLVGPHQVFANLQGFQVQLVWKTKELVTSDAGLAVQPTITFKDCPEELA